MIQQALGRQLLVEYHNCTRHLLDDTAYLREVMIEAARVTGATVVGEIFHHFSPHGVSGVVVIAESHLSIHTWPEYRYAAVDLFTCGREIDPYKGFELLKDSLGSEFFFVREVKRGEIRGDGLFPHKPPLITAETDGE